MRDVTANVDGEPRPEPVTRQQLDYWIPNLEEFLIVGLRDNPDRYIQTLTMGDDQYRLEYREGAVKDMVAAYLTGATAVAALIWDWVNDDWQRLNELSWEPAF